MEKMLEENLEKSINHCKRLLAFNKAKLEFLKKNLHLKIYEKSLKNLR